MTTSNSPVDLETSVAGEEDPGASNEIGSAREAPRASDQPAARRGDAPTASRPMSKGDEAPAGTPGTGEDVCPACGGSGQRAGRECPTCGGTGKVTVGIGGA